LPELVEVRSRQWLQPIEDCVLLNGHEEAIAAYAPPKRHRPLPKVETVGHLIQLNVRLERSHQATTANALAHQQTAVASKQVPRSSDRLIVEFVILDLSLVQAVQAKHSQPCGKTTQVPVENEAWLALWAVQGCHSMDLKPIAVADQVAQVADRTADSDNPDFCVRDPERLDQVLDRLWPGEGVGERVSPTPLSQ